MVTEQEDGRIIPISNTKQMSAAQNNLARHSMSAIDPKRAVASEVHRNPRNAA